MVQPEVTAERTTVRIRESSSRHNYAADILGQVDETKRSHLHLNVQVQIFLVATLVTTAGFYVRLIHVLASDFPLNDGGLFYLMTQELQRNGYVLPAFTSYNNAGIPFAYPPLGFYLAGGLADLFGWPLIDVVRVLPGAISALAIPAVFFFARSAAHTILSPKTPRDLYALTATVAAAFLPATYDMLIEGGGLTRAPGYVAAIATCYQAFLLWTQPQRRWLVGTILGASLTVLAHPGAAWFAASSVILLWLWYGRTRIGLRHALLVALGTVILTSPWWGSVVARHGVAPLVSATMTPRAWSLWQPLLFWRWTQEPLLPIFAFLGLLGLFRCINDRRWILPAWIVSMLVLNGRSVSNYAALPLVLLAGVGVLYVLVPALGPRGARIALCWGAVYAIVAAWLYPLQAYPFIRSIEPDERAALRWVATESPPESRFIVITSDPAGHDPVLEWFPALTGRVSVATTQGYEWLYGELAIRIKRYDLLQSCTMIVCVEQWALDAGEPFTHIYLSANSNTALKTAFYASRTYQVVYDEAGVVIFQLVRSS